MDKYDFFECVVYDVNCIPRGRLITKKRLMGALKKGIGLCAGCCYNSIIDNGTTCDDYFFPAGNFGNGHLVPITDTLVQVPKVLSGDHLVGHVLCDLVVHGGTLEPSTPRLVAQRQIQKLEGLSLKVKSSFEIEFNIMDENNKPWGHNCKWASMDVINETQQTLLSVVKEFRTSEVLLDTVEAEAGPGQYEFTTEVAEGIKGADMTIRFKSISRPIFKKFGLKVTYTPVIHREEAGLFNAFHFNHSLWDIDEANAFFDPSKPNQLSTIGQHWLAGLIKHAPAITALLCPTTNCYRRLHTAMSPTKSDCGTFKRGKAFRIVTEREGNVYIEARIPSSACNPYLVMAGIVAAGIHGVKNKLTMEESDQETELPLDLGSALQMLKDDEYILEALGWEFVEQFCTNKKVENDYFQSLGDCSDDEQFQRELDFYLTRI